MPASATTASVRYLLTVMATIGLDQPPVGLTVFVIQAQNPDIRRPRSTAAPCRSSSPTSSRGAADRLSALASGCGRAENLMSPAPGRPALVHSAVTFAKIEEISCLGSKARTEEYIVAVGVAASERRVARATSQAGAPELNNKTKNRIRDKRSRLRSRPCASAPLRGNHGAAPQDLLRANLRGESARPCLAQRATLLTKRKPRGSAVVAAPWHHPALQLLLWLNGRAAAVRAARDPHLGWGDFAKWNLKLDLVFAPAGRTAQLARCVSRPAEADATAMVEAGRQPLSQGRRVGRHADPTRASCHVHRALSRMRFVLVHGARRRGGQKACSRARREAS